MKNINSELMRQSVISGGLVGIGVVINLLSENKYIGSMLFSFALLAIIHNGTPLYTGRIGFIAENKITDLLMILIFNLIGVAIPVFMAACGRNDLYDRIIEVSQAKFMHSAGELFLLGALCGVLMFIAVYSKKTVITVFCIMIFILSGYEHCIADFPFLLADISIAGVIKFLCIAAGNSVGSIVSYWLIIKKNEKK